MTRKEQPIMLELQHFDEFINQKGLKTDNEVFYRVETPEDIRNILSYCASKDVLLCSGEVLTKEKIEHFVELYTSSITDYFMIGYIPKPEYGARSKGVYFYTMTTQPKYYEGATIYDPVFVETNEPKTNLLNWLERSK